MNGDPFEKRSSGEVLKGIPADTWNAILDAARAYRRSANLLNGGSAVGGPEDSVTILVQNTTDKDVAQFGILAVSEPAIPPAGNNIEAFVNRRAVNGRSGGLPNDIWLVTQEPIPSGHMGSAVIMGMTPARVEILDQSHRFATGTTSQTELRSTSSGPIKIIWKQNGLGIRDALVLLQWFDDACCQEGAPPPGGGGPCQSTCDAPGLDCMKMDILDPDGQPWTLLLVGGGGVAGQQCGWIQYGGPVQLGGYIVSSVVTLNANQEGLFAQVTFTSVATGLSVGRVWSSVCGDYKAPNDWPLSNPLHYESNSPFSLGSATILRVYPAPGECGGGGIAKSSFMLMPPGPDALMPGGSVAGIDISGTAPSVPKVGGCSDCGGGCAGGCGGSSSMPEMFNLQGTGLLNLIGATVADVWVPVDKIANETTASDTALSNDATLFFAMEANRKYRIKLVVYFKTGDVAGNDGFKWGLTGPASPTVVSGKYIYNAPGIPAATGPTSFDAYPGPVSVTCSTAAGGVVEIDLIVHNGANPGTFAFQWSQNTSDTDATTVRAGSALYYRSLPLM